MKFFKLFLLIYLIEKIWLIFLLKIDKLHMSTIFLLNEI